MAQFEASKRKFPLKRLHVTILDLATNRRSRHLYSRLMNANFASIMPQAVATWCEKAGHAVRYLCYTGSEELSTYLSEELRGKTDLLFVSSFTRSAQTVYAISHLFRQAGAVTAIGGPHARCYPEDAAQYFDYVLGFTDEALIRDILDECAAHRAVGVQLSAQRQPAHLPGVQERWKFIETNLAKAPLIGAVPMIGSLGCPYTCSFCIDASVPYQPVSLDQIREDLRFVSRKMRWPLVAWHDPNFGVRFDEIMTAIEDAVPPGRVAFVAESSLSLLSEPNLRRLQRNCFKALLPGIESWFELGNKSKTGTHTGMEKVERVADHVNQILRYVPYVQTNFVLGLDSDQGAEPFELTKRFLDLAPGAFPTFSLLTAFGRSTSLNLDLQREGRVLPFPFHFLDNNKAMNVSPKHYGWREFYDHVVDLTGYAFSWPRIWRRVRSSRQIAPRAINLLRASSEGFGRLRYHSTIRRLLDVDPDVRRFLHGESDRLPRFYEEHLRSDLGPLWEALPRQSLMHDPNAYLKELRNGTNGLGSLEEAHRVRSPAREVEEGRKS
jgi:hypothetical protein